MKSKYSKEFLANTKNYTIGREKPITEITIHHAAAVGASAKAIAMEFRNPARNASATYCIGITGEIYNCVAEENTPYTNGDWDDNSRAITIECANDGKWTISKKTEFALCMLIADIARRYNMLPLTRDIIRIHSDYENTECPGEYITEHINDIIELANAYATDSDSMPNAWAFSAIVDALANGILFGDGNSLNLRKNPTREEVLTFIDRSLNK